MLATLILISQTLFPRDNAAVSAYTLLIKSKLDSRVSLGKPNSQRESVLPLLALSSVTLFKRTLDIQLGKLALYQLSYTRLTLSAARRPLPCCPIHKTTELMHYTA